MEWHRGLELRAGEVVVRPYRSGDIDELFAAARESTEDVYPWLPWCHPEYQRTESEDWVRGCRERSAKGESYDFAVLDRKTSRFLGGCSLNAIQLHNRLANLGYWVRSSESGRGVATAATRIVASFGFRGLDLRRIEIVVAVGNAASLRVAEKAGFRREGLLRNRLFFHGRPHDAVMFSLVPDDLGA